MSDVKLPGVQAKVTVGTAAEAQVQLPPGQAKKIDAPPPADAFKAQLPLGGEVAQLTGQAVGFALPAAALAVQAKQIQDPAQAQNAFQGAYLLVKDQLLDHPGLPREDVGQRANEFFTEYAKAFVQTSTGELVQAPPPQEPPQPQPPPPPEQRDGPARAEAEPPQQQQAQPQAEARPERPISPEQQRALAREFADSLKMLGFQALKNEANGKDGVENAFQLLSAEGMKEFTALAKEQKISIPAEGSFPPRMEGEQYDAPPAPPPPADGGTVGKRNPGGEGPAAADGGVATERSQDRDVGDGEDEDEDIAKRRRKKPGKNKLWGWLGTFRRQDENVRQAEEKWDRATVAAVLFLLLLALVVAALASL
ncbi:MAG TPA: hypothetical protein VIG99_21895 [Myxococcaceae bacterium]|jgi:hypothetical protein